MHRFIVFGIFALLSNVSAAPFGETAANNLDWEVTMPTLLTTNRTVHGDVLVRTGATLEVSGATLEVGERLLVEAGATLKLSPRNDRYALITPVDDEKLMWLEIEGHIESRGEPQSVIEGLRGDGIDSVVLLPGGMKLNGTGDLHDIRIQHGTAGVVVGPHGELNIENGTIYNLMMMGIATRGKLTLRHVDFYSTSIAISGKGPTCNIHAQDVQLYAWAASMQTNACPTVLERAVSTTKLAVVYGNAPFVARDVVVRNYTHVGFDGDGKTSIRLERVTFDGSSGAKHGVQLSAGHHAVLVDVRAYGHKQSGVYASRSIVEVKGGAYYGNGEHGIHAVDSNTSIDLPSIDFVGSKANAREPLNSTAIIRVFVQDDDANLEGVRAWLYRNDKRVPLMTGVVNVDRSAILVYNPWTTDASGKPVADEGIRLRVEHSRLARPYDEPVPAVSSDLRLHAVSHAHTPWSAAWVLISLVLAWRIRRP